MTEPGSMPPPGPERARSDRWLEELARLREGGPVRRYATRTRVVMSSERVSPGDPEYDVVIDLLSRSGQSRPAIERVEVALYPLGSPRRALPLVIVDVRPGGVVDALTAQGGEVDVRGEPAPGHAVVLVFDDGRVVGCTYPAQPPPPIGARHRWGFRG